MTSTKTGERLSGPLSEVIGAEELRSTQPEANELVPLTKKEVEESISSVDGDQALSGHTQSLSADNSQNEKGEQHEQNEVSSSNDLEDSPSLGNSKCEQVSADNGRETATDKSSTRDPSLGYETGDEHTSTADKVDQSVFELPSQNLHRVSQARMREKKGNEDRGSELVTAIVDDVTIVEGDMARLGKNLHDERLAREVKKEDQDREKNETQHHEHQESPATSGPDPSKSSQQQHDLNPSMHADRLQKQRNLRLKAADAIYQVGAASNQFSEVPDTRGPSGPTGGGSNHALQDYQMQLMLLEQSNKMRLMRARQEQDGVGEINPDDKPEKNTVPAACAPQELPDTAVEMRSCGGNDSSASRDFKAHL